MILPNTLLILKELNLNYFFVYIGELPNYVKTSINSVLSVDKNAKIYFCGEKDPEFKNTTFINSSEIRSKLTQELIDLKPYKNTNFDQKINSLWFTSLLRIFYINDFMKFTNINQLVHFDSDVIIYKPFMDISEQLTVDQLNITKLDNRRLIFGYSYIPSYKVINFLCEEILKNFKKNMSLFSSYDLKPLSEMETLSLIHKEFPEKFNLLPDLPYFDSSNIFDPASYGQFLGGTHSDPKKWYTKKKPILDHDVGLEIKARRIKVKIKNSQPIVVFKNKEFKLVNLHIHSKKLDNFIPKEYKNYI